MMADIILRNLDDALKERLRIRAARNGRSMAQELREIVRASLTEPERRAEHKKVAAQLRKRTAGRNHTPAWKLQREGREER
ncbi:MAG TPA: Arc family DNA-binding protein [Rudaea sp.]|nr:Arc family DNA-binding protein [Rudaea sp.]